MAATAEVAVAATAEVAVAEKAAEKVAAVATAVSVAQLREEAMKK